MSLFVLVVIGFLSGNPATQVIGVYKDQKECMKASLDADKEMQAQLKKGAPIDAYKLRCEGFKLGK